VGGLEGAPPDCRVGPGDLAGEDSGEMAEATVISDSGCLWALLLSWGAAGSQWVAPPAIRPSLPPTQLG
jgi:hypothetical protein